MEKKKIKDEAKEMIAVALGMLASSLLFTIGTSLCLEEIWIGIIPLIIGYEFARWTFIFLIKNLWRTHKN